MKKTFLIGLAALFFAACSSNTQVEAVEAGEVAEAEETALTLTVDSDASSLTWVGSKLLGKSHNGTIAISGGSVSVENGMMIAGNFTTDMTTIKNNDLPEEGEYNQAKLVGHLMSNDFFNVEQYPTSTFQITSVNASPDDKGNTHNISGNLTIRDVTKEITFPAKVTITENGLEATADFSINRMDWGVNWDKEAVDGFIDGVVKKGKDDFVKNEVALSIKLVAKQ